MTTIRFAAASLNQTPLDFNGNNKRILDSIRQARSKNVEVLCLPELCISGYGCEDAFVSINTINKSLQSLEIIAEHCQDIFVCVGMPVIFESKLYNCAVGIHNKKIVGVSVKHLLPKSGVHYESRWFNPWLESKSAQITILNQNVPIGAIKYEFNEFSIGVEICEEGWSLNSNTLDLSNSVDAILNPSASYFTLQRDKLREQLIAERSRLLKTFYVYSNLLGLESGRIIYDGVCYMAHAGKILSKNAMLLLDESNLLVYDFNLNLSKLDKIKNSSISKSSFSKSLVSVKLKSIKPSKSTQHTNVNFDNYATKGDEGIYHQFLQVEILGLWDYMRKSAVQGFVVSLSGGCDSAVCAILVQQMLKTVLEKFGIEKLKKILKLDKTVNKNNFVSKLLSCVYQKTANSSLETEQAATSLAACLGAKFSVLDVNDIVEQYKNLANTHLDKALSWRKDDIALQNIQARVRSPLVWLIANAENKILLTTSNRSEATLGYATMDGDMSGGLAPIAGIDKDFLRQWLKYYEAYLPCVSAINSMEPKAELRPNTSKQTDEDDLMPYTVLKSIELLFVNNHMAKDEMLDLICAQFSDLPKAQLSTYLDKFLHLWKVNQWKRERMAPSFHLDEVSVDPKTSCRFPILSGDLNKKVKE